MSKTRTIILLAIATSLVSSMALAEPKYRPQSKAEAAKLVAVATSDADLHERVEALRKLSVIGGPEIVAELAPLLANAKLSHMARYALEPIPDASVDDAFRAALGKLTGDPLVGVINSIGVRRDAKAVTALAKLLAGSDEAASCAAAGSLGRIATEPAAKALAAERASAKPGALRRAVVDASLDVASQRVGAGKVDEAVAIYRELHSPAWPRYARLAALVGLIEARPDQAADLIISSLGDKDAVVRATALARAVTLKGEGVTARLAAQLAKCPAESKPMLIAALGDRGDKAALPALLAACAQHDANIRRSAVNAIGKIGDASCVAVLVGALDDTDASVAAAAADSLRILAGKDVDAAILQALGSAPSASRVGLIDVLAARKAAGAAEALLKQAAGDDSAVALAAVKALGRLAAPKDLPAILDLLAKVDAETLRAEAVRAVVAVSRRSDDTAAQTDAVLAAMKAAKTPQARAGMMRALGGIGGTRALAAVRAAVGDSDATVADAAIRAIAACADPKAIDAILDRLAKTPAGVHRVLLLRGAARLLDAGAKPVDQTIAVYKDLLAKAESPADRKLILAGLGNTGSAAALKVIESAAADAKVKAEAQLAMCRIASAIMATSRDEAQALAKKILRDPANDAIRRTARTILNRISRYGDYVTSWQYAGPYAMDGKTSAELFALELGPEKADKGVQWTTIRPSGLRDTPWMFNLGDGQRQACYVRTWVHSDKPRKVQLSFGTDDGYKLWVGGKLVSSDPAAGAATPDEHKVDVTLAKGWTPVMLKVVQDVGAWQFCMRLISANGGKVAGIIIRAAPPKD